MIPSRQTWLLALLLLGLSPAAMAAPAPKGARDPAPRLVGTVNLNTGALSLLKLLPGIGPRTAAGIVRYRARRLFRHTREIRRVRGVGRRKWKQIKRHLTVRGPSTLRLAGPAKGGEAAAQGKSRATQPPPSPPLGSGSAAAPESRRDP